MKLEIRLGQFLRVKISQHLEEIVFEEKKTEQDLQCITIKDHQYVALIRQIRRFIRDPSNSEGRSGVYAIDAVAIQFEENGMILSNAVQSRIKISLLEMKLFLDQLFINRRVFFDDQPIEDQNVFNNFIVIMSNIMDTVQYSEIQHHFNECTENCKLAIRVAFKSFSCEVTENDVLEAYFAMVIHLKAILLLIFAGRLVFVNMRSSETVEKEPCND